MEIASFVINGILAAITIGSAIAALINRKAAKKSADEAAEYASNANAANIAARNYHERMIAPNIFVSVYEEGRSLDLKVKNCSHSIIDEIKVKIAGWDELIKSIQTSRARDDDLIKHISIIREAGFSLAQGEEKVWRICPQNSDLAERIIRSERVVIDVSYKCEGTLELKAFTFNTSLLTQTRIRNEAVQAETSYPPKDW